MFCQLFMLLSVLSASETSALQPDVTCYTANGKNYRGTVAQTTSGITCQSWSAQTPHKHRYLPNNFPLAGLDKNYCRNPRTLPVSKPWCYTTDSTRTWAYCPVPKCPEDLPRPVSKEPKQVFNLKVTLDNPTVDLNDPAVIEAILKQMKEKLKQQGVSGDVKLTWKKQPDGKALKKEQKTTKKKTEF